MRHSFLSSSSSSFARQNVGVKLKIPEKETRSLDSDAGRFKRQKRMMKKSLWNRRARAEKSRHGRRHVKSRAKPRCRGGWNSFSLYIYTCRSSLGPVTAGQSFALSISNRVRVPHTCVRVCGYIYTIGARRTRCKRAAGFPKGRRSWRRKRESGRRSGGSDNASLSLFLSFGPSASTQLCFVYESISRKISGDSSLCHVRESSDFSRCVRVYIYTRIVKPNYPFRN